MVVFVISIAFFLIKTCLVIFLNKIVVLSVDSSDIIELSAKANQTRVTDLFVNANLIAVAKILLRYHVNDRNR